MPTRVAGLILTPHLTQRQVKLDLHFEPSVGILARKLDTLGYNLRNFKEPLKESVKTVVIPSIRRNFDAGGRPRWAPLALGTIAQKHGDARPLIRSGALRRQMGYLNTWHIDTEKAMILDLPQKVWYGKIHQAGYGGTVTSSIRNISTGKVETITEEAEGGIPARPFVLLQRGDETKIHRVFERWLAREIKRAGLASR